MRLLQLLVVSPPREPLAVILVADRLHLRRRGTVQSGCPVRRDVFLPANQSMVAVCRHPSTRRDTEGSRRVPYRQAVGCSEPSLPSADYVARWSIFLPELFAKIRLDRRDDRVTANEWSFRRRDSTVAGR